MRNPQAKPLAFGHPASVDSIGDVASSFAFWDLYSSTAVRYGNLGALATTAVGSPTFGTRTGWLTLNDSSSYTFDSYAALAPLYNLREGVMLLWARVSMNVSASGQNHILSFGAGAGPQIRFSISTGTSFRPSIWIAFDGDTSATEFAGGSNEFAAATDTTVILLVDNRVGRKRLFRYVDGAGKDGYNWAAKGAVTPSSSPTQRARIGADANTSPGSTFFGDLSRVGVVNFGERMPTRINDIIQGIAQSQGDFIPLLARSL